MFQPNSRYKSLPQATMKTPDGGEVVYVRRRFLPQAENMPLLVEVAVNEGDRLDLIAYRTLGDPEQFWRICDANKAQDPFDLVEVGRALRVPLPQFEEPR